MENDYKIDMCYGPLFGKILLFALPLIVTSVLQLLFNAADLVVLGHFSDHEAMAAVGATMNLNSLVINIFIGLSIGTNVVVARLCGAKSVDEARRAAKTSMAIAFFGGIILMTIALATAREILILMKTPQEVLDKSCLYIRICFSAIPFIMIYNFGCAILRAVGDTRRPSYFLIIAGIINVILNLIFVVVFKMGVAGVAVATAVSHLTAAALLLRVFFTTKDFYRINLKEWSFDWKVFFEILRIGVPASVQSSCFAVSNMLIQSSINSFGTYAMAGTTAALGVEGITYVGSFAFHQTAISFTAQNLGGRRFKRILTSLLLCLACGFVFSMSLGWLFFIFGQQVLAVFDPDPEVIRWGMIRFKTMFTCYGLCALMDVASGGLRGIGYSLTSAMASLVGACLLRIWWVFYVFPLNPTMELLLFSYPVSWFAVGAFDAVVFIILYRKIVREGTGRHAQLLGFRPGSVYRGLRYLGGAK